MHVHISQSARVCSDMIFRHYTYRFLYMYGWVCICEHVYVYVCYKYITVI